MASIMSRPDYSSVGTEKKDRLSVHLPKETLFTSIMTATQGFHFDPETARMARNVNMWLSSDDESSTRPSSVSEESVRSFETARQHAPIKNPKDNPVLDSLRGSFRRSLRGSVRGSMLIYDDMRPRPITESTEKLHTPADGSINGDPPTEDTTRHDGQDYPKGMKLFLITLALCLAVFVMALDNSIIATAIPRITDDFHSLGDVGWYGSAYMLTGASLQLFFGKFYTFWSIKWTFLTVVGIFEVGSLICGAAPNSITLIIGRAIAGVGSAGIFAGALTILAYSVPLTRRPVYTGLVSGMYGISSVAGPLLGGVFTDQVSWRWCFYINLPIGAITVVVIAIFFPDPQRNIEPVPWRVRLWQMDPIGTSIFMPAIVCLLLALQWGGIDYPWDNARITSLLMLAAVLLMLFVYVQYKMQDNATVPPRIIRKRTVWAGSFFAFNTGACFLTSIYFLPIWFQAVQGASAISSGVRNLPMLLGLVLFSILSGAAVSLWGFYTPFMIAGSGLMAIGFGLVTTFTPDTKAASWIGYQLMAGIGVGISMQQPLIAVQVVCDMADIPTGTAMIIFVQTLGGALFISASQTVFTNKLIENVIKYVPDLDPQVVLISGATNIRDTIRAEWLDGVILAYNGALTTSFYVGAATASATIVGAAFMEWRNIRGKNIEMTVA
ncbi:Fc.00g094970.m01.CDS01 [Cosmosporella sp. VM-42]